MKVVLFLFCFIVCNVHLALSAKEIVVGINTNSYPPYYINNHGHISGFSLDVAELIASKLGYSLTYRTYPWARINQYLREGKIDMVLLYLKTEEREKYVHYSKIPYITESYNFFKNTGNTYQFNGNLNSIVDTPIAVIRGYSYGPTFDQTELKQKYIANSETQLIDMLIKDRVALILGNEAVIQFHMREMVSTHHIEALQPAVAERHAYFAFSKKSAESEKLNQAFSKVLSQLIHSDEYKKLLLKHRLVEPNKN